MYPGRISAASCDKDGRCPAAGDIGCAGWSARLADFYTSYAQHALQDMGKTRWGYLLPLYLPGRSGESPCRCGSFSAEAVNFGRKTIFALGHDGSGLPGFHGLDGFYLIDGEGKRLHCGMNKRSGGERRLVKSLFPAISAIRQRYQGNLIAKAGRVTPC